MNILRLPPLSNLGSVGGMIFSFVGAYQEDFAPAHDQGNHLIIITPLTMIKGILTTWEVGYASCFTQILNSAMNTEIMLHIRTNIWYQSEFTVCTSPELR